MKNPYEDSLWEQIKSFFLKLICKLKDHDWESDDVCEPDHGSMGATCKRCGYSWETLLY